MEDSEVMNGSSAPNANGLPSSELAATAPPVESTSAVANGETMPAVTATSETKPAPSLPDSALPVPDPDPVPTVAASTAPTQPGLSAVADFLPANAKLDHPVPSPLEPLGSGATDAQGDATMTDAAAPLPIKSNEDLVATSQNPAGQVTELSAQSAPVADLAEPPTLNGVHPPDDVQASPAVPEPDPAATIAQPNGPQIDTTPVIADQETSHTSLAQADGQEIESMSKSTEQQAPLQSTDVQMTDSTSSLVRPREDDEGSEEPSAKRSRLDDFAVVTPVETPTEEKTLPAASAPDDVTPVVPAAASTSMPAPTSISSSIPAAPTANGTATSHLPPRSTYSSEPLTRFQKKTLEEKIKNTKKVKSAFAFLRPVDPVALGIPNYPNIITYPMDLGTMEHKLKSDQYSSLEEFVSDFEAMVNNCFTFNGPAHVVSGQAMNLRAYFLKQMDTVPTGAAATAPQRPPKKESPLAKPQPRRESRASTGPGATAPQPPTPGLAKSPSGSADTFALLPGGTPQIRRDSTAGRPKRAVIPPAPRDLPYSGSKPKRKENQVGLKFAEFVIDELRKPRYDTVTVYFREPVDPVALNIPHYYSIIKQPMDIQTMTKKLKTGQYSAAEEFKSDFELMINNAKKFNPADHLVHTTALQLQGEFEALWRGKNKWVKEHQPRSNRVTPTSEVESDEVESSEEEQEDGDDEKAATIRALQEQMQNLQNMLGAISGGAKRESPKASSKKKSRPSGGASGKSKKASSSAVPIKAAPKPKSKKARLVTYDEKQEISNATELMNEDQVGKLTSIITENVAKYKNMAEDDMELEIDDLPNDVQHKLLKYVRSLFPPTREEPEDPSVDDDYEPERGTKSGGARKKHKPMKKHEQESRIAQLSAKVEAMKGGLSGGGASAAKDESSDDEASESSEEE